MSEVKSFNCPKCGTALTQPAEERFCHACGLDLLAAAENRFSAPRKKNGSTAFMIPIVLIALIVMGCASSLAAVAPTPSSVPILPTETHAPSIPPATSTIPWTPAVTSTPISTQPPVATPTATSEPCYRWDQVTKEMTGQTVCVYGVITDFTQAPGAATRYKFSNEPDTFFLFGKNFEIFNTKTGKTVAPGTCIRVTATLRFNGGPYIDLGDLQGASSGPYTHQMNGIRIYDNASACDAPPMDTSG
jgi:hypothetical protein